MPDPYPDPKKFLDQAVDAVVAVLGASTDFMHSTGLVNGVGKVRRVDKYDAFIPHEDDGMVYCSVFQAGDKLGGTKTPTRQERFIHVPVLIFGKTVVGQEQLLRKDRPVLWRDCSLMQSVATWLAAKETHGSGGNFGGFSQIVDVPTNVTDEEWDQDKSQYTVRLTSVFRMQVILQMV